MEFITWVDTAVHLLGWVLEKFLKSEIYLWKRAGCSIRYLGILL